jgi:TATA element modulatory factor
MIREIVGGIGGTNGRLPKGKAENQHLMSLNEQLQTLQKNHDVMLELLGEKTERVHELEQDIVEMKEVYRTQIEELLSKVSS